MLAGVLGVVPISAPLWVLLDPRFDPLSWGTMCLSYLLYQAASIVVLSSIAVESHALLVSMKHLVVVVLVSIWVGDRLTLQTFAGTLFAGVGVWIYLRSTQPSTARKENEPEAEPEVPAAEEKGEAPAEPPRPKGEQQPGAGQEQVALAQNKEGAEPPKLPQSLQLLLGLLVLA